MGRSPKGSCSAGGRSGPEGGCRFFRGTHDAASDDHIGLAGGNSINAVECHSSIKIRIGPDGPNRLRRADKPEHAPVPPALSRASLTYDNIISTIEPRGRTAVDSAGLFVDAGEAVYRPGPSGPWQPPLLRMIFRTAGSRRWRYSYGQKGLATGNQKAGSTGVATCRMGIVSCRAWRRPDICPEEAILKKLRNSFWTLEPVPVFSNGRQCFIHCRSGWIHARSGVQGECC